MIECPICHVMNEDQAYFCSECGQRFSAAMQSSGQSPPAQAGPTPGSPPRPGASEPQQPEQLLADLSSGSAGGSRFNTPDSWLEPFAPPGSQSLVPPQNSSSGFSSYSSSSFAAPAPDSQTVQSSTGSLPSAPPGGQPFSPGLDPAKSADLGAFPPPGGPLFTVVSSAGSAPAAPADVGSPPADRAKTEAASGNSRSAKLRSPMLGGDDTLNMPDTESAQKGKQSTSKRGLHSPLLGGDDSPEESSEVQRLRRMARGSKDSAEPADDSGQTKGRGLRSPLLGNEQSSTGGKGKGLHSPLLGGGDFDDEPVPQQRVSGRVSKSLPLHSPLLGGDDDYDRPKGERTEFPHRRRPGELSDEPHDDEPEASTTNKGLRSPLLGDESHEPQGQQRVSGRLSGQRRLHSPVLDGTSEYYLEETYEPEPYDENDPNILRSPLLAAKQKMSVEKPPQVLPQQSSLNTVGSTAGAAPAPSVVPTPAPPEMPPFQLPPAIESPAASMRDTAGSSSSSPPSRASSKKTGNEEHTRVPLSIYDSGLRETLPGAPVRSGPSLALMLPAILALAFKFYYWSDLARVPNIQTNYPFLADQAGQLLLLFGVLLFSFSAKRRS